MLLEIGVYGGAIPFAVALALVYLIGRLSPALLFDRFAMAAALAVAFFVGWVLLPDGWTPLKPQRPWHWLPYLGLLAAVLGAIGYTQSAWSPQRLATNVVAATVAAWLLAPNWPDLEPPRYVYILLLGGYQFALMTLLDALPDRLLGRLYPFLLFAATSTTAIVIALPRVLTLGQITGIATASLFGCIAAGMFVFRDRVTRGLTPVYAILVGGIGFWGSIDPEPAYSILLAPLAPLMLWLCAHGPLARLAGRKAVAAQLAVVLVPLAILVAWTLLGGEPEYSEYDY
jgi:hypothetical protein